MNSNEPPAELNSSQKRHLFHSAEYADKLLADIEAVLYASKSKSLFPKYEALLSPAQTKAVEDYLAPIRAQMLHVVESQDIPSPEPKLSRADRESESGELLLLPNDLNSAAFTRSGSSLRAEAFVFHKRGE
jgi:hypothetical protein